MQLERYSFDGIRQDTQEGERHDNQSYLAMEYARNGTMLDLVMKLHAVIDGVK